MSLNLNETSFIDQVKKKEEFDCEIYNKMYARLIRECKVLNKGGEFSYNFIELQQNFLWKRPPEVKNLIRLVKHWYQLVRHLAQTLWALCIENMDSGQRKGLI